VSAHIQNPRERFVFFPNAQNPFDSFLGALYRLSSILREARKRSSIHTLINMLSENDHYASMSITIETAVPIQNPSRWSHDDVYFWRSGDDKVHMVVHAAGNTPNHNNYFLFSLLQEYIATRVDIEVGHMWVTSAQFGCQAKRIEQHLPTVLFADEVEAHNPYASGAVSPFRLINGSFEDWLNDLEMFDAEGAKAVGYKDFFFRRVALPMLSAQRRATNITEQPDMVKRHEWVRAEAPPHANSDCKLAVDQWLLEEERAAAAVHPAD